jgi:hypothetical protein
MTVDLFGYSKDDFIDGVEFAGAASYFDECDGSNHVLHLNNFTVQCCKYCNLCVFGEDLCVFKEDVCVFEEDLSCKVRRFHF